jgi:hypothetical protein
MSKETFKEVRPLNFQQGRFTVEQGVLAPKIRWTPAGGYHGYPQWTPYQARELRDWLNVVREGTPTGSEP